MNQEITWNMLVVDGRIILKWILNTMAVDWFHLSIKTNGRILCERGNEFSGSTKRRKFTQCP